MMFRAWYKKEETVKSPPDHTGTTDVPAFSPVKQEKRTPISSRTRGSMTIPGHFPKKAEHAEKALRFKGRNGEFSPPSCASGPAVRSLSLQGRQAFRNMKRKIPALLLPEDRPPVRAEAPPPADAGHKKKSTCRKGRCRNSGAGRETRTLKVFPPADFESAAFTNSTIPAQKHLYRLHGARSTSRARPTRPAGKKEVPAPRRVLPFWPEQANLTIKIWI